ncbi:unnamed protein product [Alopecurus aequalis]
MAKCLALAILLLVVLAYCDGRELSNKDHTLAATRGAGAVGDLGEEKDLGLPVVGTVTSTITGPLVVVPVVPIGRP